MNRKNLFRAVAAVAVVVGGTLIYLGFADRDNVALGNTNQTASGGNDAAVMAVVANFGGKLKDVSLLAPDAGQTLRDKYQGLVAPALLEQWASDPSKALGREVSSPWPDRIEIASLNQAGEDSYTVSGNIVEVTSADKATGGASAKQPVEFQVKNIDGAWLITGAQ